MPSPVSFKGKVGIDSNILVYAALEPQTPKGRRAQAVICEASVQGILATQSLLEFVAVVRRRAPTLTARALTQVAAWMDIFETVPTTNAVAKQAFTLMENHQFQVWDAVICTAVAGAGANIFLSEDLQDGLALGNMVIANPFKQG